jgi:hypothetical protein
MERRYNVAKKVLVAVYSASGVTRRVGEEIARISGGDFFEIMPKEPYTSADLDWMNKKSRSSVEMNDPSARPEIGNAVPNMGDYDTVIIGFPIWWGICPRIIDSWLENNLEQLESKTLIPFATSGGSGIEQSETYLKKTYPSLHWQKGLLLNKM